MIRFFRTIRYSLIGGNSTSRYVKYAIGEIVLVVIGILIALQIDNWNESRKIVKKELRLYCEIFDDLNSQYTAIGNSIDDVANYQKAHYTIYNESKGLSQYDPDFYYNYIHWIHRFETLFNKKYLTQSIKIANDEVRFSLEHYINQELIANVAIGEWNAYKRECVRPFLSKNGVNNSSAFYSLKAPSFSALTQLDFIDHSKLEHLYGSVELDQILFDLRFKTSWMLQNLIWLQIQNERFEEVLKRELRSNNLMLQAISDWEGEKEYLRLIREAHHYSISEEYQNAASKYKAAFDLAEPNDVERYKAICVFALAKDRKSAFHHLFVLANGPSQYKRHDWIKRDKDLVFLHGDKRWEEFLAIVQANKNR